MVIKQTDVMLSIAEISKIEKKIRKFLFLSVFYRFLFLICRLEGRPASQTFTIEFYGSVLPKKVKIVHWTTLEDPQNAYANMKILKKMSFFS